MSVTPAWLQEATVQQMVRANPLHGNPLSTRSDLAVAAASLVEPLLPHMSAGMARIRIGVGGAHYSAEAAEMEAFARPLWGLAPLVAGGIGHERADDWAKGLENGTNPEHPEYWGDVNRHDQRMVEMAGLSLGILLARETFWDPMPAEARARTAAWLRRINAFPPADNNWLFFRVLTNLALRHVGEDWSEDLTRQALDRIEDFHIAGGHYRDGTWYQLDYYTPMGMHFYGLMIAQLVPELFPDHAARYRARARDFAQDFQSWFAHDGAAIPFGRSMTYRFAQSAFWSACAFAGEEVLPWGRIKGLLLRNLRWWADRPIADRDGILSIGYGYPNLLVSEAYNAPGSPYWGLKAFLPLALPEDHPFWMAEEEPAEALPLGRHLCAAGAYIARRESGDVQVLTGGQDGREHRYHDAKYGRFAYSTAFAFSVASDAWGNRPERAAVDCGIAVSRDGLSWLSRATITEAGIDSDMAWGRWSPDDGLCIDSWLDFGPEGWHVRLHRVVTDRPLQITEGGFAIDRTGDGHITPEGWITEAPGLARVRTHSALSVLSDVSGQRAGTIVRAAPNTNLLYPRTFFPRLSGEVPVGKTWLATAAFGRPDPQAEPAPFILPETARALLSREGISLGAD
ncbi:DUF2264 domain-containing protein [Pseudoroseicyclus aestuarii]|uniref:DUF2264 domain-containing protein n=1 Tax=Pseudoroseicyclus aestuarii TaxID=1795041 RepID=A0A318T0K2_9RHOB|nr:DUF2264 domain-containing protein [Pseudoroseicyclus aestuarii]PYE86256.1 hypothetical protein DFP88_101935 [Pseudoroseicyclus aestuarii]